MKKCALLLFLFLSVFSAFGQTAGQETATSVEEVQETESDSTVKAADYTNFIGAGYTGLLMLPSGFGFPEPQLQITNGNLFYIGLFQNIGLTLQFQVQAGDTLSYNGFDIMGILSAGYAFYRKENLFFAVMGDFGAGYAKGALHSAIPFLAGVRLLYQHTVVSGIGLYISWGVAVASGPAFRFSDSSSVPFLYTLLPPTIGITFRF